MLVLIFVSITTALYTGVLGKNGHAQRQHEMEPDPTSFQIINRAFRIQVRT